MKTSNRNHSSLGVLTAMTAIVAFGAVACTPNKKKADTAAETAKAAEAKKAEEVKKAEAAATADKAQAAAIAKIKADSDESTAKLNKAKAELAAISKSTEESRKNLEAAKAGKATDGTAATSTGQSEIARDDKASGSVSNGQTSIDALLNFVGSNNCKAQVKNSSSGDKSLEVTLLTTKGDQLKTSTISMTLKGLAEKNQGLSAYSALRFNASVDRKIISDSSTQGKTVALIYHQYAQRSAKSFTLRQDQFSLPSDQGSESKEQTLSGNEKQALEKLFSELSVPKVPGPDIGSFRSTILRFNSDGNGKATGFTVYTGVPYAPGSEVIAKLNAMGSNTTTAVQGKDYDFAFDCK